MDANTLPAPSPLPVEVPPAEASLRAAAPSAAEVLRVPRATTCIELTEWTGQPREAASVAGTPRAEGADVQALRWENERLLADLTRTQTLLLQKKAENANLKSVVRELTDKRAGDVAQRHNAQEALVAARYDNARLLRCHEISRQVVADQQGRIAAQAADLDECSRRMHAAEGALAAAQRNARALRGHNATLEKKVNFFERLQLVESRMESPCVRSYQRSLELY